MEARNESIIISVHIAGSGEGGRENREGENRDQERREKGRTVQVKVGRVGEPSVRLVKLKIDEDSRVVNQRLPEPIQVREGEETQEQQDQDRRDDNERKDEKEGKGGNKNKYNYEGEALIITNKNRGVDEKHKYCHQTGCTSKFVCRRCIEAGRNSHSFYSFSNYKRHCVSQHGDKEEDVVNKHGDEE